MARIYRPHAARRERTLHTRRGLWQSSEGAAVVEFAFIAPVFLVLLLGVFDMGQMLYAKSVLDGAVQSAARLSALETGDTGVADTMVENSVKPIIPSVTLETSRLSYFDFADLERPEKWDDDNGDGTCNNSESYTDENGNGSWDSDIGVDGNGGANDVVIYTVSATYTPLFKVPFIERTDRTLTSTAVRKNQPFANQEGYGSKAGTCT